MSKEIKNLDPALIWNYFYDLTQIPRPSGKEAGVAGYIRKFGEKRGLETLIDPAGNVIIKKPATPGMEDKKTVLLQGHLDMVPQKNSDKVHDFEKDPIEAYIEGEWVCAHGTTLGADNGIGVAAALAVLDAGDLVHGPVEALFTVDEESGMTGANGLEPGILNADIMLNMDSEDEGELYTGCAGGLDANIKFTYHNIEPPSGHSAFRVEIKGLKGGHSGLDIDLGRGNANKLLFRFLKHAVEFHGALVANIDGGGLRNAIPREASATVVLVPDKVNSLKESAEAFAGIFRNELSAVEPDLSLDLNETGLPGNIIDKDTISRLIRSVIACPNGVIRMSNSMHGLVETSTNLASVRSDNGVIDVKCLMRSSVDSSRDELASMMEGLFTLAGAGITFDGAYPGWKPNMDSEILAVMKNVYKALYGKTPEVKAIHAGLECGIIGGVYPGLDMISFGPTIRYPHSPDEKVHIESVHKFWVLLTETLKNIPGKN
ncbi:MAG: aminoacyl-histidine dipeptidase [Marinilabiliales bacterium]|nr:MAG: aminoacyl-histidine dipeptidase [Marinilabiliales bacterium]